jgi:hypothetical protein
VTPVISAVQLMAFAEVDGKLRRNVPTSETDAPPGPACYIDIDDTRFTRSTALADQHEQVKYATPAPPVSVAREWQILRDALGLGGEAQPALFQELKWASVEKCNSLMKVKTLPAVKALTQIFSEAGFEPSVNFNTGLGELSLTIPLFANEDTPLHARRTVVRTMLAAMPEQAGLEGLYAAECAAIASQNAAGFEADACDLLANRCLDVFAKQTGAGIWQRTVDVRMRTVKICFAAYTNLLGGPRKALKYSPCYTALTGFRDSSSHAGGFLLLSLLASLVQTGKY